MHFKRYCDKLTKVTIGKNVTKINKNAFKDCGSLKTIIIKTKKLKKVGKDAFSGINKNGGLCLKQKTGEEIIFYSGNMCIYKR